MNLINEEYLKENGYKIINGVVKECKLKCEYGYLVLKIVIKFGNSTMVIFPMPELAKFPELDKDEHSYNFWNAGLAFIAKLINEIFDAYDFSNIAGSFIRVAEKDHMVKIIGHIVNDSWISFPNETVYSDWTDQYKCLEETINE